MAAPQRLRKVRMFISADEAAPFHYPSFISEYAVIFLTGLQSRVAMMIFTAVRIRAVIRRTATGISKLFFCAPITENMPSNMAGR